MNKREIEFLFVPNYIIDIFIKDLNRSWRLDEILTLCKHNQSAWLVQYIM